MRNINQPKARLVAAIIRRPEAYVMKVLLAPATQLFPNGVPEFMPPRLTHCLFNDALNLFSGSGNGSEFQRACLQRALELCKSEKDYNDLYFVSLTADPDYAPLVIRALYERGLDALAKAS